MYVGYIAMKLEIHSAVSFLAQLVRLQANGLTETQLELFKGALSELLSMRYRYHWFPDKPHRGSAYRCLRINSCMDPVIAKAGETVGVPTDYLRRLFPSELTMWIDPAEVSYRIGENGSICILYTPPRGPMVSMPLTENTEFLMERVHGPPAPTTTLEAKYDLSTYATS